MGLTKPLAKDNYTPIQERYTFPVIRLCSQYGLSLLTLRAMQLHRFLSLTKVLQINWFYRDLRMHLFVRDITQYCPGLLTCTTCPFSSASAGSPKVFRSGCVLKELRERELWYKLPARDVRSYIEGCYERTKKYLVSLPDLEASIGELTREFFNNELRKEIKKESV